MLRRRKSEIITEGVLSFVLMVFGGVASVQYSTNTECTVVVQYSGRVYNRGGRTLSLVGWGWMCVHSGGGAHFSSIYFLRSGTVVVYVVHASLCTHGVLE